MNAHIVRPAAVAALLLTAVALLAACGRKGPVRPPLTSLPAAPAELALDQQGADFLLAWTVTGKNQDGSAADDLAGFRIYRFVFAAADGCPTCRDPDQRVAEIDLQRPEPAVRIDRRLYWRDPAVTPGTGHSYLVVPLTVGGREGDGVAAFRAYLPPPPAPAALTATPGDRQVRLQWTPPPALPDGQELIGYNLYRRPAGGAYPPVPLNGEPLREALLTDFVGESGREAVYRVTALTRSGKQLLESAPSNEAAATPLGAR